jgi:hypothetical protein
MSDTTAITSPSITLDIVAHILKFSDEERDELVHIMKDTGKDSGFQDA